MDGHVAMVDRLSTGDEAKRHRAEGLRRRVLHSDAQTNWQSPVRKRVARLAVVLNQQDQPLDRPPGVLQHLAARGRLVARDHEALDRRIDVEGGIRKSDAEVAARVLAKRTGDRTDAEAFTGDSGPKLARAYHEVH